MMDFLQLEELVAGRLPDIWVVCGAIERGKLKFELAYLNSNYGGSEAILVPVGTTSPQIRVLIPEGVRNRAGATILVKPTTFTIAEIIN